MAISRSNMCASTRLAHVFKLLALDRIEARSLYVPLSGVCLPLTWRASGMTLNQGIQCKQPKTRRCCIIITVRFPGCVYSLRLCSFKPLKCMFTPVFM